MANFTFDEFRKILAEEGLSPSVGVLNRVWSAIQKRLNPPVSASAVEECVTVWVETLKYFSTQRPIMPSEKAAIWRAINECKDAEAVKLAIYGARYEKGPEGFDPSKYISLTRIFDPRHFTKLMSIGAQERAKRSRPKAEPALPPQEPSYEPQEQGDAEKTPMTPEARALLAGLGLVKPVAPPAQDEEQRRKLLRQQAEMLAREGRTNPNG